MWACSRPSWLSRKRRVRSLRSVSSPRSRWAYTVVGGPAQTKFTLRTPPCRGRTLASAQGTLRPGFIDRRRGAGIASRGLLDSSTPKCRHRRPARVSAEPKQCLCTHRVRSQAPLDGRTASTRTPEQRPERAHVATGSGSAPAPSAPYRRAARTRARARVTARYMYCTVLYCIGVPE